MRNIFLEKSYTKCDGKTIPRPFSKKLKFEPVSGLIALNVFYSLVLLYAKLRGIEVC